MSIDSYSIGTSGATRFASLRGKTPDGSGRAGVKYPSPFFDIAQTYFPPTIKELLKWCKYYSLTHPLICTVIHRLSEYPITEIVIDEENVDLRDRWANLLGQVLRIRQFQVEVGLDYFTYGICFATIHFPFTKYLVCRKCGRKGKAKFMLYKWHGMNYNIECGKCGYNGPAIVEDWYERDVSRIRLHRWNPEYVHIDPGFGGAEPIYTFEIPEAVRKDVQIGKKNVLDTIPDVFLEAMRRNKFVVFRPENIFVFKRPTISQKDEGWGMPLILPVLKDCFYLQILRKSQEAIALEHVVPLRILFPQAGSNVADPYSTVDLSGWKMRMEQEILRWKFDPNYLPILPLPVGTQSIGGDGKALDLAQEMQTWSEQIVAGMGVPREFVWGGMTFSGSNVSMRMLENMFINYHSDQENMINNFIIRRVSNYMGWPAVSTHMKRFKLADDLQRTSFAFQLNQGQKISDQTLLDEADFDLPTEDRRKALELKKQQSYNREMQLTQATIAGESSVIQARYQGIVQKAMMESQQAAQPQMPGADGQPPGQLPPPPNPNDSSQPAQLGGQQGEMVPGQQVDPAMPEGSTVSPENVQQTPADGIPTAMKSPMNMGAMGGGVNLLALAKRAASALEKMDPGKQLSELTRMKGTNPQLYSIVLSILHSKSGSQANPLNPLQSPLPSQKPSRSPSSVGL